MLSGHLDHIGITPPIKGDVKGDSINNGALDNASGVATTLEVARLLNEEKLKNQGTGDREQETGDSNQTGSDPDPT